MDSGFNISGSSSEFHEGRLIEIGRSERFRYYKTRRNGILQFVKIPSEEHSHDLLTTETLRKEFLLGYGLNHPGIVRYYALENGCLYEEYIEGENLRELFLKGDTRLRDKSFVSAVCRQLLEALSYLHSQGVVHLDLKPENIMVTKIGNRIKIIDLSCGANTSERFTTGYTIGYEAPEQITGGENVATDIFQTGKIIEELSEASGCRKQWRKFIDKATANHPDNRFTTAEEALKSIPGETPPGKIFYKIVLALLIFGGIACVIIFPKNYNTKEEKTVAKNEPIEEQNNQERGEGKTSSPSSSAPVVVTANGQIKTETAPDLSKVIDEKLEELYSVKVTPMFNRMKTDSTYRMRKGVFEDFTGAYTEAFDKLILYGKELKNRYPDKKDYIDEQIHRTFEVKTYYLINQLYPPYSNKTSKEMIINSPQSSDSIAE